MLRLDLIRPLLWIEKCRVPAATALIATFVLLAGMAFGQEVQGPASNASTRAFDPVNGTSVEQAVTIALRDNAELDAMRKEVEAAEVLLRQAGSRPNPTLDIRGSQQAGGSDNSFMIEGGLPLELGGRRAARVAVAAKDLEIRRLAAAEQERTLAFEVRNKFGEALAAIMKLQFIERTITLAKNNVDLVAAQVAEGRRPPLDQNMELVELNRIRALRESSEAAVELKILELKNLLGVAPDLPFAIRGELVGLLEPIPPEAVAAERAIETRPDLQAARAAEGFAAARGRQARAEGRLDAELMVGYQRMRSSFPLLDMNSQTGALMTMNEQMNFVTFGVKLMLPVRDRKEGMAAAARLEENAARSRREFGELTAKRQIAASYVRYNRAMRAKEIYRIGVREQAEKNLDVVRQMYELGSRTLLDHIAEQRRFIETENGYIDALLEVFLARSEILRTTNSPELINK
ncbi:MAG: TolC family protein [Acidobacteria bacterium]|nr:TolC family protein [Acidobacteriota bacterium]